MIWVVEADGQKKKKGRGVVKGVKAAQKRFASGSAKLNITFSEMLGGTIGMNYRSFKDDVVVIMKRKVPLIGVRRWSDIHPSVHRLIVADVIVRTTFFTSVILFYHRQCTTYLYSFVLCFTGQMGPRRYTGN
jgi:hypothetical protein